MSVATFGKKFSALSRKVGPVFILAILVILCSIASPYFLTASNMLNVLRQSCIFCLIGLAQGANIICGALDLSCECICCLSGIAAIPIMVRTESIFLGMLTSIIVAMILCGLNGTLIATLNLPPFISGLALQMAIRGFILVITKGLTIIDTGENFKLLGQGSVLGIPLAIFVEIAAVLLIHFILKYTSLGRNMFAMGGNSDAAFAAGINIKKYRVYGFLVSGFFTGVGGYMYMSRTNSGIPNGCNGLSGKGIAAAIIGGVAFSGGVGNAFGIMVGAWIMCIITNILNLLAVDANTQDIISGAIILVSVALDIRSKGTKK